MPYGIFVAHKDICVLVQNNFIHHSCAKSMIKYKHIICNMPLKSKYLTTFEYLLYQYRIK